MAAGSLKEALRRSPGVRLGEAPERLRSRRAHRAPERRPGGRRQPASGAAGVWGGGLPPAGGGRWGRSGGAETPPSPEEPPGAAGISPSPSARASDQRRSPFLCRPPRRLALPAPSRTPGCVLIGFWVSWALLSEALD